MKYFSSQAYIIFAICYVVVNKTIQNF